MVCAASLERPHGGTVRVIVPVSTGVLRASGVRGSGEEGEGARGLPGAGQANESGRGFGSGIVRAATLSALALTIERVIPEPPDPIRERGHRGAQRSGRRPGNPVPLLLPRRPV